MHHGGPEDTSVIHGVATAMNGRAHNGLFFWEPVCPRLAMARFRSTAFNMTVIPVYAPTVQVESNAKDDFYKELQSLFIHTPRCNILLIPGDWNTRTAETKE